MAIAAVRFHARNERGLAHILERRSPQAGVSPSTTVASASTTSAAQIEDIKLPTSVKALTGMIVVFSLVILGKQLFYYCKIIPLTGEQLSHFGRSELGDVADKMPFLI